MLALLGGRTARTLGLLTAMEKQHPTARDHWYLLGIAVRRDQQGRGAGSRLLRFGLDRVDSAGSPAYLEASSPRSVPLYESHGFRVLRVLDLPKGAPVVTAMWREPGSS